MANGESEDEIKLTRYLWGTGTGLLARFFSYGSGFLSVFLLIRILGAASYGRYATCLVTLELLHLITNAGLDKNLAYRVPRIQEQSTVSQSRLFLSRVLSWSLIISISVTALIYGYIGLFPYPEWSSARILDWFQYLLILLPLLTTKDLLAEWLIANNNVPQKHYLYSIIPRAIFVSSLLYMYFSSLDNLKFVATSLILSHFIPVMAWLIKEVPWKKLSSTESESINWSYSIRMSMNDLVKESLWKIDVLFVYYFLGSTIAGGYKITTKLSKVANLADDLTTQVFKPSIGKYLETRQFNLLRKEYNYLRLITLQFGFIYTIFLLIFGRQILTIFGPYAQFEPVLILLALAYCVVISFGNIGNILVMEGRANWVLLSAILGITVNIVANVLLIPFLGAIGAALATGIALIIQNTAALTGVIKVLKLNMLKFDDFLLSISGFIIAASIGYLGNTHRIYWYSLLLIPILHGLLNLEKLGRATKRFYNHYLPNKF